MAHTSEAIAPPSKMSELQKDASNVSAVENASSGTELYKDLGRPPPLGLLSRGAMRITGLPIDNPFIAQMRRAQEGRNAAPNVSIATASGESCKDLNRRQSLQPASSEATKGAAIQCKSFFVSQIHGPLEDVQVESPPQNVISYCQESYESENTDQGGELLKESAEEPHEEEEEGKEEEEEISLLEYARFHGICRDYLSEHPLHEMRLPTPPPDTFSDLPDIGEFALVSSELLTKERLAVDKDAAALLKAICASPEPSMKLDEGFNRTRTIGKLKLELPILRTDNELDLLNFGSLLQPDFTQIKIPLEVVDIEKDEGLEWPTKYANLPEACDRDAGMEKLECPKDAILFIQEALKLSLTVKDLEEIEFAELKYGRKKAIEPVTPPLLPMTPPVMLFLPSPPFLHLDLLSSESESPSEEARRLDSIIMQKDAILPLNSNQMGGHGRDAIPIEYSTAAEVYSPLRSLDEPCSSPPRKRKFEDLKVEAPLTPPMIIEPSEKKLKTVSFTDMPPDFIPELPSAYETEDNIPDSQNSLNVFFNDEIAPLVEQLNKELEQEQLKEVDTTRRVEVPVMDFTLPQPPWKEFCRKANGKYIEGQTELDAQRKLISKVKREDFRHVKTWPGVSKLERELHWTPFPPQLGAVAIDEQLSADGPAMNLLKAILEGLSVRRPIDISSLTWKPEGLRILDDLHESEDELEPAEFDQATADIESLVRKRKLEIDESEEVWRPQIPQTPARAMLRRRTIPQSPLSEESAASVQQIPAVSLPLKPENSDSGIMPGGLFSTSAALTSFMKLQGKLSKELESNKVNVDTSNGISTNVKASKCAGAAISVADEMDPKNTSITGSVVERLPHMPVPNALPKRSIIISSTLLPQRRLMRHLRDLYPDADLVDRDFTSPSSPSLEADIILSPATGVILTTLQKIKQRALPGQAARIGIKENIAYLSNRYERLVVFVSEGRSGVAKSDPSAGGDLVPAAQTAFQALDARDCEALTSLMSFTAALEAEVTVSYTSGGDEELARWIVNAASRFCLSTSGPPGEMPTLLHEETQWELYLRRSGLNAYAAQVILVTLKVPSAQEAESSSFSCRSRVSAAPFGLPAFILMAAKERLRLFEGMLGGRRVLSRVSRLLDQRWWSAANGFREPV